VATASTIKIARKSISRYDERLLVLDRVHSMLAIANQRLRLQPLMGSMAANVRRAPVSPQKAKCSVGSCGIRG
jgi:hypothetical protein